MKFLALVPILFSIASAHPLARATFDAAFDETDSVATSFQVSCKAQSWMRQKQNAPRCEAAGTVYYGDATAPDATTARREAARRAHSKCLSVSSNPSCQCYPGDTRCR